MSSPFTTPKTQAELGLYYFLQGWHLMFQRRLLPFVIFPIVINTLLIVGLIWLFFTNINSLLDAMLPSWLEWLNIVLIPLIFILILVLFYFTFTTLANFIAAPFNALLAEKVEQQLTGKIAVETTLAQTFKDIPRMLSREWRKMLYSLPRLLALFVLGFIPVLGQTIVPVLAFMFGAWLLAIQYCDYPFDNHKIHFSRMKNALSEQRVMTFTFGGLVSLFTALPFINLVVMPVAVCGATAMWVKEYRDFFVSKSS